MSRALIVLVVLGFLALAGIGVGGYVDSQNRAKAEQAAAELKAEQAAERTRLDAQEHDAVCKLHAGDKAALKLHGCK